MFWHWTVKLPKIKHIFFKWSIDAELLSKAFWLVHLELKFIFQLKLFLVMKVHMGILLRSTEVIFEGIGLRCLVNICMNINVSLQARIENLIPKLIHVCGINTKPIWDPLFLYSLGNSYIKAVNWNHYMKKLLIKYCVIIA